MQLDPVAGALAQRLPGASAPDAAPMFHGRLPTPFQDRVQGGMPCGTRLRPQIFAGEARTTGWASIGLGRRPLTGSLGALRLDRGRAAPPSRTPSGVRVRPRRVRRRSMQAAWAAAVDLCQGPRPSGARNPPRTGSARFTVFNGGPQVAAAPSDALLATWSGSNKGVRHAEPRQLEAEAARTQELRRLVEELAKDLREFIRLLRRRLLN